jgi:hypothetical protein
VLGAFTDQPGDSSLIAGSAGGGLIAGSAGGWVPPRLRNATPTPMNRRQEPG